MQRQTIESLYFEEIYSRIDSFWLYFDKWTSYLPMNQVSAYQNLKAIVVQRTLSRNDGCLVLGLRIVPTECLTVLMVTVTHQSPLVIPQSALE